ncbi:MAG: Clp protease N-terminal domain-containing protein [Euzebya sp.]
MFERFTADARQVVIAAQEQARSLRHPVVGTEHLLLGLLDDPTTVAGQYLRGCDLELDQTIRDIGRLIDCDPDSEAQAAALETIGIDLDRVRSAVEAAFGEGALERSARGGRPARRHTRFSPRAKSVLELSLREALRLKDGHIGPEHVLLGLLREGNGVACMILADHDIDHGAVETYLRNRRRQAS